MDSPTDPWPLLHLEELNYSLSDLAKLSAAQLALARFSIEYDDSMDKKIIRAWRQRREKSRAKTGRPLGRFAPAEEQTERWVLFELVDLNWEVPQGAKDLESLTTAQLVVMPFHPGCSDKDLIEEAGDIFFHRREKGFAAGATLPAFLPPPPSAAKSTIPTNSAKAAPPPAPTNPAPLPPHVAVAPPQPLSAPAVPAPTSPLSSVNRASTRDSMSSKSWLDDDLETHDGRPSSAAPPARVAATPTTPVNPRVNPQDNGRETGRSDPEETAEMKELEAKEAQHKADNEQRKMDAAAAEEKRNAARKLLDAEREKARERDRRNAREPSGRDREGRREQARSRSRSRDRGDRDRKRDRSPRRDLEDVPDARRRRSEDDRHPSRSTTREPAVSPLKTQPSAEPDHPPHYASPSSLKPASTYSATPTQAPPPPYTSIASASVPMGPSASSNSSNDTEIMPHYLHRNLKQLFVSNLPEHVTIGQARNFFDDHEGLAGIFLGSASQKYHNCASWLIFTNSRDRDACLKKLANGVTFPGMKVPLYVEYAEPTKVRVSFKWLDMSKEYRKLHRPAPTAPYNLPASTSSASRRTSSSSFQSHGMDTDARPIPRGSLEYTPLAPFVAIPASSSNTSRRASSAHSHSMDIDDRPSSLSNSMSLDPYAAKASPPSTPATPHSNIHPSRQHFVQVAPGPVKPPSPPREEPLPTSSKGNGTSSNTHGTSNGHSEASHPRLSPSRNSSPPLIVTRVLPTDPKPPAPTSTPPAPNPTAFSLSIKGSGASRSPPASQASAASVLVGSSGRATSPAMSRKESLPSSVQSLLERLGQGEDGSSASALGLAVGRREVGDGHRMDVEEASMRRSISGGVGGKGDKFAPVPTGPKSSVPVPRVEPVRPPTGPRMASATTHSPPLPRLTREPELVLPLTAYYVSDHLFPVQNRPVVLSLNLHINKDNHREDCLVLESRQQLSSGATAAPTEVVRIVPENLTSVQYPSNFPTGKDAIVTFWLRPSAPASLITQLFSMIERAPKTEPGLDQVSLTVRVQSDLPGGTHCSPDLTKRMHDFCDHVSTHWTSVEARLITGATGEAKAHDFDRLLESHWRKHPRDSPFVKGAGTNGGPESSMEVDS